MANELDSKGRRRALPLVVGIAIGAAIGAGGAWRFLAHDHEQPAAAAAPSKPRYHCPMHPTYTSDRPGDCPICGMKLTPIVSEVTAKGIPGQAAVQIDARRQQSIGVRTAAVTEGPLASELRAVGRVAIDETRVRKVHVKVDGYVERLYADFTGKPVKPGQPLLTLYSPELLSVQNEYLLALKTSRALGGGPSGDDLVASARKRLELWDVSPAAIEELERTQQARRAIVLHSPVAGIVTAKNVVQGSKLSAGDTPFEITDLSQVWVLADAHEADLPRLRIGAHALLKLQAFPDRTFTGRVSFIEPIIDGKTRTAKVRLSFANPRGDLRPDLFGEVTFHFNGRRGLQVPSDAVIDSGERKIVFVASGDGGFDPREVVTGDAAGDFVEVKRGLRKGERVAVRASFLIDSESRLKAALAELEADPHAAHRR